MFFGITFVIFSIVTLGFFLRSFSGYYQKELVKTASRLGRKEVVLQELDEFYNNTKPLHGVKFSENYLLYQNGIESVLLLIKNIRRIYI